MNPHPYRFLGRRLFNWLRRSLNFLWLIVVAGYLSVQAGQAVYGNYRSQQQTQGLKDQLVQLQQEKSRLEALLVYYHTDAFKEKELRRNLLMEKPGEKLYMLPESSGSQGEEDVVGGAALQPVNGPVQPPASLDPTWKQWVRYVWHDTGE